jgi:hypothetical protein
MLKIFYCLTFLLFSLQVDSSAFYIEKIGANTKYDSRYIFNQAFQVIPQDRPVRESDIKNHIECLVRELKASGLFEDVKVELSQTEKANARSLLVNAVYHREFESFVISEVVLNGFREVDMAKFQSSLNKAGIELGDRLLKYYYYELEKKIGEALVVVYPKDLYSDEKAYWLSIRPDGERKVKLIVSPSYSGCRPSVGK